MQEGLASAWALVLRAVIATNLGLRTSKPKAAVAVNSRIPLPKPLAAAVQPKRRPPDEGQKATEPINLLSSPGVLFQVRKCCPYNHNPSPLSSPCCPQQGGNAPVQEVQSWVLGDFFLGHLLLGHCRKCRDNTHTQDASLQPGAGPCVPMCLSWAFISKELSLSSGWVHVSFSASPSINAQCHLILSVSVSCPGCRHLHHPI